jgi:hypothetical protein
VWNGFCRSQKDRKGIERERDKDWARDTEKEIKRETDNSIEFIFEFNKEQNLSSRSKLPKLFESETKTYVVFVEAKKTEKA